MWIDKNQNESASSLETRLDQLGAKVTVSGHVAYSIAYSANGVKLLQKETVSVVEFRSLTKDAADLLATLSSDSTSSQTWYRELSGDAEYAVVAVTTGSKTDYVANRVNEADAWHVTKTTTTYEASNTNDWTTTRPTVSQNGMIVNQSRRKTFLAWNLGTAIYQNESVVVREYPFLTLAEAQAKCGSGSGSLAAANSNVFDLKIATSWSTSEGVTAWKNIQIRGGGVGGASQATDTTADMRYEGPERGWVVTATSTTYWGSSS